MRFSFKITVNEPVSSNQIAIKPPITKPIVTEPMVMKQQIIFVKPGDTIQKIARRYYGDSSRWRDLVDLNQLDVKSVTINGKSVATVHIIPGQELKLNIQ